MEAHLYSTDEDPYDQRDENYRSSEEYESFYCEVCDRDFASEDNLSEHKKQHKICGIDGCKFSAHPLLVEKHINMQHSSGLYHRIKDLSTPADIEKWLEERRKRYPTTANIKLRKAEESEKVQRGEIIKQKQDGVKRKKIPGVRDRKRRNKKRSNEVFNVTPQHAKELYRGLYSFSGTSSLLEVEKNSQNLYANDEIVEKSDEEIINHISDEEDIPNMSIESSVKTSFLPNLVANYGSDSEDDAPEEVPIKERTKENEWQTYNPKCDEVLENQCLNDMSTNATAQQKDTVAQSSICVASTNTNIKSKNRRSIETNRTLSQDQKTVKGKHPKRLQLLERLLSRSIQHERNLICQCIKYIVDNHFFD